MNQRLTEFLQMLDEAKKTLREKKDLNMQKLERMFHDLKKDYDNRIQALFQKKDLIAEAIRKKWQLREWKVGIWKTIFPIPLRFLLSAPFIYGMIVPGVALHLAIEIYQNVCFRLYGIPLVRRKDYFIFDQHILGYLNSIEKLNCLYCSYFNGLIAFTKEIAGRTERYWCPIKHGKRVVDPHSQYWRFFDYLDGKSYREKRRTLRDFTLQDEENGNGQS